MTARNMKERPQLHTGTALEENQATTLTTESSDPRRQGPALLACVLAAPAAKVTTVLTLLRPELVALVDAPTSRVLAAAADLAARGVDPTPVTVVDELQRVGEFVDGHHAELLRSRVLDAATNHQPPERLRALAAALAAQLLRARGVTAGEAITATYASGAEDDCEPLLLREGAAVRELHRVVEALRSDIGRVTE
ncbi:MAG: hypothetical protein QM658_04075 [Gordonia sp. (in: high G+C Gram-positive bacteria)]